MLLESRDLFGPPGAVSQPAPPAETTSYSPRPGIRYARQEPDQPRRLDGMVDAGGENVADEQAVPGVGELSLFEDPEGRVLGLWKQQKPE
jgi:predicted enzyme related to lactoylglutathione lyase